MPRTVEGFGESEMLFCNYSAGDALLRISGEDLWKEEIYGAENRVHEFVHVFRLHQIPTFYDSHRELGDHCQVLLQSLADLLAKFLVVVQCLDLSNSS